MMYRNDYLLVKVGLNRSKEAEDGEDSLQRAWKLCVPQIYARLREAGGFREIYSVYGEGVANPARKLWREPCFNMYQEYRWNQVLLEKVTQNYFILLGVARDIPEILKRLAPVMKGLRWIPGETFETEGTETGEEWISGIVEQMEDYGLVVEMITGNKRDNPAGRILKGGGRKFSCGSKEDPPVCVLDFMKKLPDISLGLPKGSLWVDYTASSEKRGKLSRYKHRLTYTSLICYWEECRRRVVIPCYQNDW